MKKLFTFLFIAVCGLSINAQNFESIASGNWSTPATWTLTSGTDADGIPDQTDNVTIKNGHTVKLTTSAFFKTLTVESTGFLNGNNKSINMYGNFNLTGKVTNALYIYVKATSTFSASTNYSNAGNMIVQSGTLTIAAGTSILKAASTTCNMQCSAANTAIINNGTVSLGKGSVVLLSTGKWFNKSGSSLKVIQSFSVSSLSTFNASAASNTVTIDGTAANVPPGTYDYLILNSNVNKSMTGNVSVASDLTVKAGTASKLTLNAFKLSVGGNIANSGTITCSANSTVTLNGTTATTQVLSGNALAFYNLEVNNTGGAGVIFSTAAQNTVSNALIPVKGDINSNNRLTLKSDATTTARIAPITTPSNVTFSGQMIIQKYLPGDIARYSDFSVPVSNTIVFDWDNEMYISGIGPNDGIGGPAGTDGDVPNFFQSMNTYDETQDLWSAVTGSATPLVVGRGYDLWCEDLTNNVWDAKVLDSRGTPNYGNVSAYPITNTAASGGNRGYNLIGNPYASCITYANCTKSGMTASYCGILNNSGNITDYGSSYIVTPLQGFWVRATNAPTAKSVTFTEAAKTTDVASAFNRIKPNYDIKLMFTTPSSPFYHENVVNFNSSATLNYDEELDAPYIKSPVKTAPALYTTDMITGENMSRNTISSSADEVTLALSLYTPTENVYYIDASVLNTDDYKYAWIENIKDGKTYDLDHSIVIQGTEKGINKDYVLRLSKTKKSAAISANVLESDLIIFNTENMINLKSNNTDHMLQEVTVYDMTGKLMLSQKNVNVQAGNVSKIDVSSLANGIYIVNAIDEQGRATSKKLVK